MLAAVTAARASKLQVIRVMECSLLVTGEDDLGGRRVGVKFFDERRAALEHRALVDVALVGDLVRVDRERLSHLESAPPDGGAARPGFGCQPPPSRPQVLPPPYVR